MDIPYRHLPDRERIAVVSLEYPLTSRSFHLASILLTNLSPLQNTRRHPKYKMTLFQQPQNIIS